MNSINIKSLPIKHKARQRHKALIKELYNVCKGTVEAEYYYDTHGYFPNDIEV